MNKVIYCNICNRETDHKFRGTQPGIPGKTLDLYDCLKCKDTCGRWENDSINFNPRYIGSMVFGINNNSRPAERFRESHPHLCHWLNTGLGRTYLKKQLNQKGRIR